MKKKILTTIFLAFIAIFMCAYKCEAVNLDEIINYTTTVSPRDDGTLDINYKVQWKVLDSTLEGPLEWVKIGIPNQHVDEIKKISNNIKKIKYLSSGGNYVRIDFKDKYKEGEVVNFEFSIHQSYMYTIDNSTGRVTYTFTPGWFEDIEVKNAIIKWKAKDVIRSSGKQSGEYIVWSKELGENEKITSKVEYSVSSFNLNYRKQASNVRTSNTNSGSSTINPNVAIFLAFIVFIIVYAITAVCAIASPSYYRHGGYGYYGGYYPYRHHYHCHHHHGGLFHGGFGGGFGGGRRRRRLFLCVCLCMCWRRTSWMCKKGFLWD